MRAGWTLTLLLAVLLTGCGGSAATPTATTGAPTSPSGEAPAATEAKPTATTEPQATPTTEAQPTTALPVGAVSFSGEGAFTSELFSLPEPSSRYLVEATAGRIGDSSCLMAIRIEEINPLVGEFGAMDAYWWATYTYEGGPSTETHTQQLMIFSPSDQFRLVTEPQEGVAECTWSVTLRPE